ncbi:hypothetical protein EXIGLDRAFT_839026 [Exidia glandulosa HHB12029]|uniref:Uncharacterized protein n=1 Tax=Exidia glandulosa HHB12029 TaxID=1314781 RepID=A0A165FAZ7_EXIGL|nr:hypothetical protein EXIGLDRAFT_839026 [Exidia glandulosa HHB12029]
MSTTDPASWAPQESAADLWNERSYLAGILIGAVAYGVHATLFFITLYLMWNRPRSESRKSDNAWMAYIVLLFTLSSIGNGAQFKFTEMIFINQRAYPGGPSAYLVEQQNTPIAICCVVAYTVNNWLQDGLILYRFWIIYGRRWSVAAIPTLLFVATLATSLAFFTTLNGTSFFLDLGAQLLTAYYSISVGLNVILTVAIVARLWIARHRLRRVSTLMPLGHHYSVAAMLIESAFLYSACGIMFLIPWGLGDPFQNLVLPTLAQIESIAPLLIIMRVMQGQAWSANTGAGAEESMSTFIARKFNIDGTVSGEPRSAAQSDSVRLSRLHADMDSAHDDKTTMRVRPDSYSS